MFKYGNTPINEASRNGHLDVVKYLYETCHAKIPDNAINEATKLYSFIILIFYPNPETRCARFVQIIALL